MGTSIRRGEMPRHFARTNSPNALREWLHKKKKLDLPEERCTQRTLRQCGIGEVEALRPRPRAQVTEEEITRRAVARMTLEEWQTWMQKKILRQDTRCIDDGPRSAGGSKLCADTGGSLAAGFSLVAVGSASPCGSQQHRLEATSRTPSEHRLSHGP